MCFASIVLTSISDKPKHEYEHSWYLGILTYTAAETPCIILPHTTQHRYSGDEILLKSCDNYATCDFDRLSG